MHCILRSDLLEHLAATDRLDGDHDLASETLAPETDERSPKESSRTES
jgi:hypothetical protein